jgi:hypothetical protein
MGWKIIFAPQALEELEQIVRFIAQDDPQAAIRFGDYSVDRAETLRILGSARVSRAGDGVLTIANFSAQSLKKEGTTFNYLAAFRARR